VAKTAKAPSGFYTASEVLKKLSIQSSSLKNLVDTGRIKKVIPPDRKEGYYLKVDVDRILRERELFVLQYATDASLFEKAQEEDIQAITDLSIELFGKHGTASYETRLAQYHANPDIFYVLKQDEILVGYLGIFPLKHEAIEAIMSGMEEDRFRTGVLSPENIVQFRPGEAEEVFLIIGVRQDLKRSKGYASRLISGGFEVLENFARKGIIVKRLYATSRTRDGIRLTKGLGFKQVIPTSEEDDLLRFEWDLEKSTSPLLASYHRIVKRISNKNQ
jgi:hypothetical protein